MNTLVIIFIVLMIVMTAFAAGVVINELVHGRMDDIVHGRTTPAVKEPVKSAPVEKTNVDDEPVKAHSADEEHAKSAPASKEAAPTRQPALLAAPTLTQEQKYNALPDDARGRYDEIARHAAAVNGVKRTLGKQYEEYSIGSRKIVRLIIKRGVVVCAFFLGNSDFFTYTSENRIAASTAPTLMKITSDALVSAAKDTIDRVVRSIGEETALKRKLANERRKKKASESAQSAAPEQNNNEGVVTE